MHVHILIRAFKKILWLKDYNIDVCFIPNCILIDIVVVTRMIEAIKWFWLSVAFV